MESDQRVQTRTDSVGNKTSTWIDSAGRTTREQIETIEGSLQEATSSFNDQGLLNFTRDAKGLETSTSFDAVAREVTQVTRADNGQVLTTRKGYDDQGRLLWSQQPSQDKNQNPDIEDSVYMTFLYKLDVPVGDPRYGRPLKIFFEDNDAEPLNNSAYTGNYEEYDYDARGRQTDVIKPVYLDESHTYVPVRTRTIYENEGSGKDQPRYIIFNAQENWSANKAHQTATQNVQFEFTYNADSERATLTYPSGMVKNFADFGQPSDEVQDGVVELRDQQDRIRSVKRPEGQVNYTYNDHNGLASLSYLGRTVEYKYGYWGELAEVDAAEGHWTFQRHINGLPAIIRNTRASEKESRVYDASGRLESIEHRNESLNALIFKITYELSADGSRVGLLEKREEGETPTEARWKYEYDELGRLRREMRDDDNNGSYERDISYSYDVDSNRTALVDHIDASQSRTYEYYAATQRLKYVKASGVTQEEYIWDSSGRLDLKKFYANGQLSSTEDYAWGVNNTLAGIEYVGGELDGTRLEYAYNAEGMLIWRKVLRNGTLQTDRRYLIDYLNPTGYSQVIAELDGSSGRVLKQYTWADQLRAETDYVSPSQVAVKRYHADGLGSIRNLTGESAGHNIDPVSLNYTAFGSPLGSPGGQGSLTTSFDFTGQIRDGISGLQYHRARWLQVNNGQWISEDGAFDWPVNFASCYGYAAENPINLFDLNGQFSLVETLITAVVAAVNRVMDIARAGYALFVARAAAMAASFNAAISEFIMFVLTKATSGWFALTSWILTAGNWLRQLGPQINQFVSTLASRWNAFFSRIPTINQAVSQGYNDADELREAWRAQGFIVNASNHVHHFVEQTRGAISFQVQAVQSLANSVVIPANLHRLITGLYNGGPRSLTWMAQNPQFFGNARIFRDWISTQSWEIQWRWGYLIYQHVIANNTLQNFDPQKVGLIK